MSDTRPVTLSVVQSRGTIQPVHCAADEVSGGRRSIACCSYCIQQLHHNVRAAQCSRSWSCPMVKVLLCARGNKACTRTCWRPRLCT